MLKIGYMMLQQKLTAVVNQQFTFLTGLMVWPYLKLEQAFSKLSQFRGHVTGEG